MCTDDPVEWAPEVTPRSCFQEKLLQMLHYDVKAVPCFVMLQPEGVHTLDGVDDGC